ncbi:MAG TPA: hypothetical protein VFQ61_25175, partial [Polyangiaceae bacterium]|nr:hypothetical protein [Polyangiaceae bacterium]
MSASSGVVSIEAIPPLLGRYQLSQYLDSGGTADVFRAVDLSDGSTVAVKILNETARHDVRLRRYFLEGSRA